jgi:hypothetical protein
MEKFGVQTPTAKCWHMLRLCGQGREVGWYDPRPLALLSYTLAQRKRITLRFAELIDESLKDDPETI